MKTALAALALAVTAAASVQQSPPASPNPDMHYQLGPDSLPRDGVPKGEVRGPFTLPSEAYPGTQHTYWVYVPAQYDAAVPASLMVFNDGQAFKNMDGDLRAPNVLDNLIYRHEIPVMIAVFINPGRRPDQPEPTPQNWGDRDTNRPTEYNSLDDRYARVIVDELLPALSKEFNISKDPEHRGIGGASSGAIAAFTVAWHRPDAFANVISFIGSYTSIGFAPATADRPMTPGGDLYPTLIRKSPIRPIRIYLQDGSNDLDNEHGNWFLANQQMLAALHWANGNADKKGDKGPRYDIAFTWDEGAHSDAGGGAILPDVLRWIWRDQKPAN